MQKMTSLGHIEVLYQFRILIQILLLFYRNFGLFEQKIVTV